MATAVAFKPINMNSAFDILDSDVTLQQLMNVSPDGTHQFWDVGNGRGLEADLTVNFTDTSFSAGFTNLELHSPLDESDSSRLWKLTNIPMAVTGTYSISGSNIVVSIDVSGMWHGDITVNYDTGMLVSFSDSFTGSYPGFAEYLLRQGDRITGSSGNDNLLGFGGNDTMSGGGGADILNGGTGGDRLSGGGGNDKLVWGAGDVKLDGGTGTDTMNLSVNLNLRNLANSKFVNLEQINMKGGGGDVLSLNVTDVLDFSSSTNTLKILGDTADTVYRGSGWSGGSIVNGFRTYMQGAATLLVEDDIRVLV
jgi:Ca2+-binding RTX toxin-like protein